MIWAVAILLTIIAVPAAIEVTRKPMNRWTRRGATGDFVALSDGVTHYEWLGPLRGPVAVCVHGLTTPSFVWRGLARGMAALGYRVLIYDLYGRGFSDRPGGPQDKAFFVRQLDELLRDQEVCDDFTLIGYSMGGAIATCFTAAHPVRVRQLVLLAPAGLRMNLDQMTRFLCKSGWLGDWLMLLLFPRRHRQGIEAEREQPSSVMGIYDLQLKELRYKGFVPAALASLRGILSAPLEAEHRAIHAAGVPVLAVWGREDTVIPLTALGQLTEWSRNARQEVVNGAGHGLVYTHTEHVLDAMKETLRDGLNN
ncbi:alpha/beta fold hydrolase [Arenibacterium sp. CAU 1754]